MALVCIFGTIPALAVQRYIYVCHAPVAKQWCTLSRSGLFVILILITAIITMLPRVLDRTYEVTSIGKVTPAPPYNFLHNRICYLKEWLPMENRFSHGSVS